MTTATMVTEVKISFYMPTGFIDTHWVDTEDRGLALRTAMVLPWYTKINALKYLNYTSTKLINKGNAEKLIQPLEEGDQK